MRGIIISIRKKWWDLIKSGEKTLELRKTKPKRYTRRNCHLKPGNGMTVKELTLPFFCYVYVPEEKAVCGSFSCNTIYDLFGANVEDISKVPFEAQEEYRRQGRNGLAGWKVGMVQEFDDKKPLSAFGVKRAPPKLAVLRRVSA